MIEVDYTPSFIRQYRKLPKNLKEEVKEKIELFRNFPNHPSLKVHKLKGRIKGYLSFSVNYRYRIVFIYDTKDTAALLAVGDHSIYNSIL